MTFATDEELALVRKVVDANHRRLLVNFVQETPALTLMDAINLRWDDIGEGYISVRGKRIDINRRAQSCIPTNNNDRAFVWRNTNDWRF